MALSLLPDPSINLEGSVPDTGIAMQPTRTYRVDWMDGAGAVGGIVDGLTAMRQAVFKHVQTWRSWYPIYDRSYGIELHDLPSMERGYVRAVARERIRDALSVDERILGVDQFEFEDGETRDAMTVSFRVRTVFGDIAQKMEVGG